MADPGRDLLASAMDLGQHGALIEWFTSGLTEAAVLDEELLAELKGLPLSLRMPYTVRLQEALDDLRDVVASLSFALIELGLDQPV